MTLRARLLAVLVVCPSLLALASPAFAAGEDAAVREAVQQIMTEDYPGSLGRAKKKLQDQLASCLKKGCSAAVKGEVYVALGMVSSQLGAADEARQDFRSALQADPAAKLPSAGATPTIRAQWDEAAGKGSAAAGGGEAPGGEEPPPAAGVAATIKLLQEALKADREGRLEECIAKDKQALKIDENPRTRMHLASCESRSGKLVDALRDAQKALEVGIQKRDQGVMKVARNRVKELLERIPHVTFVPPPGVSDLSVRFDDRPVPVDALTKKFSVDPGKHKVVAEGTVDGLRSTFEEEHDIKEKELVTVRITLKPPTSDYVTSGQIKCMLAAKSQEEVQKCLPQNRKNLVIRVAGELSGYTDTNSVAVYTPAVNASLVSPTAGYNLGGNFAVDAVSAASPDIVSTASPPFTEYRYAGGVTGGYKPGLYGFQANLGTSSSPDYVSYTAGGRLTADLFDKLVTPTVGYTYSQDHIGRGPKNFLHDFNPLKGLLHTHEIEGGIAFVMSPTAILLIGGTFAMERGDRSQPYRYVPVFDPEVASQLRNGATVRLVNEERLPVRPLEQLPTERNRIAFGARFNKRLSSATLRLEERLYYDTWGTKGSSTDARYMVDLSRHLRVWPHARVHVQTGALFYRLAYSATIDQQGIVLPTYRTTDRELSPLITGTGGGGVRVGLGDPEGDVKYGIMIVGDVMYTRYLEALYVRQRTAVYGSVGFDMEF